MRNLLNPSIIRLNIDFLHNVIAYYSNLSRCIPYFGAPVKMSVENKAFEIPVFISILY